jgi:uncharacterized membrane protein YqjE
MGLLASAGRAGATLAAIVQTRLELAVVEVEEESQRFLRYLLLSLFALFLVGIAVLMAALFVVLVFWDSYRLPAVAAMMLVFAGLGAMVGGRVRAELRAKPPLLASTLAELRHDIDCIRSMGGGDGA